MADDKLYYVEYTGAEVVAIPGAGKFMRGTGVFVPEAAARRLHARGDFNVRDLEEATPASAEKPAAKAPESKPEEKPAAAAEPATPEKPVEPPPPAPELARTSVGWRSERTECDTRLVRWGHFGLPVLVFPPGGGDAEEIERMELIAALRSLLDAGKIKVYACDAFAVRALTAGEGTPEHRMRLLHMFQEYIAHEVVPAIRSDCQSADLTVIAAGAGIGAVHAAALVCRHPEMFSHALCASGTFNLERFFAGSEPTDDLRAASPLHFVPGLDGPGLDLLRTRFVLLASGEGRDEDIGESRALAHVLGEKGVPHRVDSWGKDHHRDWPTWREMFPRLLGEWVAGA